MAPRSTPAFSHDLRSHSPSKQTPPSPTSARAATATAATPGSSRPKAVPKSRRRHRKGASVTSTPSLAESVDDAAPVLNGDLVAPGDILEEAAEQVADAIAAEVAEDAAEELADELTAQEAADAAAEVEDDDDDEYLPEGTARVTVTKDVQTDEAGNEVTRTSVKIQMPSDAAGEGEIGVPQDPDATLEAAKKIVEEAVELQAEEDEEQQQHKSQGGKKRKAEDLLLDDVKSPEEVVEVVEGGESTVIATADGMIDAEAVIEEPPTKRTRVMVAADEFRREKMQKRALIGLSATLAVGAIIPFVSTLF